jgi:hypothetical protein
MTCKWYRICPLRSWERRGRISERWKREFCASETHWRRCVRYEMEEKGIPHDRLLPDGSRL